MILPEEMPLIVPRFAAAGLTARLVETTDPDVEDDQIEILRDGVDTRVTIQVSLVGGGYYVNARHGEGEKLVMIAHGNFRSLRAAIDRAIEVVGTPGRESAARPS